MKATLKQLNVLGLAFILALLLASQTGFAEDTSQNSGGGNQGGGGSGGGNDSGIPQFQPPAPIDQGSPGKMPQNDRKQSSAMAKAMLLGAFAQQQIMCMQMQQQAMKEKDKDKKMMMMMMAQQACNQAAETAKAAAENDKNESKTASEPAKGPTMKTPEFKMAGGPKKDEDMLKGLTAKAPEKTGEPTPPEFSVSDPVTPQLALAKPAVEPKVSAVPSVEPMVAAFVPVTSVPNGIERSKLGYDETGKSGVNATPERQLGLGTTIATAKPGGTDNGGGNGVAQLDSYDGGSRRRGASQGSGSASGGDFGASSGSSNSSEGGASPFADMMAFLNGGNEDGPTRGMGSEVLTITESAKSAGNTPNIFEYAAYRYKKASSDEGRVRSRGASRAKAALDTQTNAMVAQQAN